MIEELKEEQGLCAQIYARLTNFDFNLASLAKALCKSDCAPSQCLYKHALGSSHENQLAPF